MNAKTAIRNGSARLLSFSGLTTPQRRAEGRFTIATFHRVLPRREREAYPYPGLAVTPEELDQFLTYFTKHFDCGSLAVQHDRYRNGSATMRPLLALTFDDGQHDNYRHALPVLKRHGVKASFFIPVIAVETQELLWHDRLGFAILALVGQDYGRERLEQKLDAAGIPKGKQASTVQSVVGAAKKLALETRLRLVRDLSDCAGVPATPEFARLLTYPEIGELASDGHEIGSHSMTHCLMPECDDEVLAYEMGESRRRLEQQIGCAVESFCYPNGDADSRTALAAAKAGYRRAVTTDWGYNDAGLDVFRLRRFDMDARRTFNADGRLMPDLLAWRMSGLYPGLV